MTPDPTQLSSDLLSGALGACKSNDWKTRREAVVSLSGNVSDPSVFSQLVASMEDEDSGVGTEAAGVLARHGGVPGLRAVVKLLAENDDNLGYHVEYRLMIMAVEGFPIIERLRAIVTTESNPEIRECAEELTDRAVSFTSR